jgi:hypothetical protein
MTTDSDQNLLNRLNQHPTIYQRVEAILNIVENTAGNCTKANDAEQQVIDELRQLGSEVLHSWAESVAQQSEKDLKNQGLKIESNGKKKSAGTLNLAKFQF